MMMMKTVKYSGGSKCVLGGFWMCPSLRLYMCSGTSVVHMHIILSAWDQPF